MQTAPMSATQIRTCANVSDMSIIQSNEWSGIGLHIVAQISSCSTHCLNIYALKIYRNITGNNPLVGISYIVVIGPNERRKHCI